MGFKFTREFYIPQGYELIAKDERFGFEVHGKFGPKPCAIAFGGKRQKPDWHFSFGSDLKLQEKIANTLAGLIEQKERKKSRASARLAPHDVRVGDVFSCSWGYDQTQVQYFQVTKLVGEHSCEVAEIGQDREATGRDCGDCVPLVGLFIGEPQVRRIDASHGEPRIRIYSFATAGRIKPILKVGDAPIFAPSTWTAYA